MSQHPDAPSAQLPSQPGTAPADPPETTTPGPGWAPVTSRSRPRQIPTSDGQAEASADPAASTTPPATDPAADRQLFADKASTFAQLSRAGLAAIGGLLNMVAGAGTEAFLPDDDDDRTIPPPVGRILARRVKMSEDANLSDTGDMLAAGIGLAAWLAKSLLIIVDARLAARRDQGPAQHQGDTPQTPQPTATGEVIGSWPANQPPD